MNKIGRSSKSRIRMSYIAMALVVIALTVVPIFYTMTRSMRNESIDNAQKIFKNISSIVDSNMEKIDAFTLNLTVDTDIVRYLSRIINMDKITPEDIDQFYRIQNKLKEIVQVNQYIESIYVYSVKNDIVLTSSNGVYRSDDFEDNSWRITAGNTERGTYTVRENSFGRQVLTSLHGVPMIGAATHGYIVVNTAVDILDEFTNPGDIIVLNGDGEILKSTGRVDFKMLASLPDTDSGSTRYRGNIVTWYASEYANFKYISIISEGYIIKKLLGALALSLAVTLVGIVIVVIVINLISRYMYKPIESIMDAIGEKHKGEEDEIELITSKIRRYIDENKKLRADMRIMKSTYNDRLIRGVLNGRHYTSDQLDTIFLNVGLETVGNAYRVVLIEIDNIGGMGNISNENDRDLWLYGINNIAAEIIGRELPCVFCKDYELAGIINEDGIDDEMLRGLLKEIQDAVYKHFDISLTCAASDSVDGAENINRAYIQAMNLLDYKFIYGGFSVLMRSDTKDIAGSCAQTPMLDTAKLSNAVKLGSREGIAYECSRFAERLISECFANKELVITGVLQSIAGVKSLLGADGGLELETYNMINDAQNVFELRDRLITLFEEMAESRAVKSGDNYSERIISYINENYTDPNISLKSISDKVGVSVSYASTIINAATKTTLTNYINRRRIDDAKKILAQSPELSIEQVREMVGYTNVHSFIRQFKNFEGITPGKYREMNM